MYDRQRRIALAQDIVAASLPACGTPVERYLRARGITILPPAIRISQWAIPMPGIDRVAGARSWSSRCSMLSTASLERIGPGWR